MDDATPFQAISKIVDEHFAATDHALPLTQFPAACKRGDIPLSSLLNGRKLTAFLSEDMSGFVQLIQHDKKTGVWGVLPTKVTVEGPSAAYFSEAAVPRAKPQPDRGADLKVASTRHPTIEAIISGNYYFANLRKVKSKIDSLRDNFRFAKGSSEETGYLLWIRGFGLEEGEEEKGFMGHYAEIIIKELDDGYTLIAEKREFPLSKHPQKKRLQSKHPNWGHPFLRRVKQGKAGAIHPDAEAAQADLNRFHKEFPETTIPGNLRVFAHVYVASGGDIGGGHIQKIVVEAQETLDGTYKLFWHPNYRSIKGAQLGNDRVTEQLRSRDEDISAAVNTLWEE
jgi:hypothetical protein